MQNVYSYYTPINGISTKSGVSELRPSAHGNCQQSPFKFSIAYAYGNNRESQYFF